MRKVFIAAMMALMVFPASAQKFGKTGGIGSSTATYSNGEPTGGTYSINGSTGNARFGSQSEGLSAAHTVVVGGSSGTAGYEAIINNVVGLYGLTDGSTYGEVMTGATIPLILGVNSIAQVTVNTTGITSFKTGVQLPKYTVATLPVCNGANEGVLVAVTDANVLTFNATLTGGGSGHVMGYCNASVWTVH